MIFERMLILAFIVCIAYVISPITTVAFIKGFFRAIAWPFKFAAMWIIEDRKLKADIVYNNTKWDISEDKDFFGHMLRKDYNLEYLIKLLGRHKEALANFVMGSKEFKNLEEKIASLEDNCIASISKALAALMNSDRRANIMYDTVGDKLVFGTYAGQEVVAEIIKILKNTKKVPCNIMSEENGRPTILIPIGAKITDELLEEAINKNAFFLLYGAVAESNKDLPQLGFCERNKCAGINPRPNDRSTYAVKLIRKNGSEICSVCGEHMFPEPAKCVVCGTVPSDKDVFCSECGKPVPGKEIEPLTEKPEPWENTLKKYRDTKIAQSQIMRSRCITDVVNGRGVTVIKAGETITKEHETSVMWLLVEAEKNGGTEGINKLLGHFDFLQLDESELLIYDDDSIEFWMATVRGMTITDEATATDAKEGLLCIIEEFKDVKLLSTGILISFCREKLAKIEKFLKPPAETVNPELEKLFSGYILNSREYELAKSVLGKKVGEIIYDERSVPYVVICSTEWPITPYVIEKAKMAGALERLFDKVIHSLPSGPPAKTVIPEPPDKSITHPEMRALIDAGFEGKELLKIKDVLGKKVRNALYDTHKSPKELICNAGDTIAVDTVIKASEARVLNLLFDEVADEAIPEPPVEPLKNEAICEPDIVLNHTTAVKIKEAILGGKIKARIVIDDPISASEPTSILCDVGDIVTPELIEKVIAAKQFGVLLKNVEPDIDPPAES